MICYDLLPERIASKIERTPTCWRWLGWASNIGYPYVRWQGRDHPAYRVTYQLLVGEIPAGLELDHLCNVPMCVNPAHLEPVTHAENQRRIQDRQLACRRLGHDWTDPRNVYWRKNGRRYCGECARMAQRARHTLRQQ